MTNLLKFNLENSRLNVDCGDLFKDTFFALFKTNFTSKLK